MLTSSMPLLGGLFPRWKKKNRHALKDLPVGCVFPVDDSAKVESITVSLSGPWEPSEFVTCGGEIDHKFR
jgi:hypothetical protein